MMEVVFLVFLGFFLLVIGGVALLSFLLFFEQLWWSVLIFSLIQWAGKFDQNPLKKQLFFGYQFQYQVPSSGALGTIYFIEPLFFILLNHSSINLFLSNSILIYWQKCLINLHSFQDVQYVCIGISWELLDFCQNLKITKTSDFA